ncbi:MAG: nucleotide exchange factor GrpE [Oligoflexia bacterium]|nr:nucleotide exchange factor GrpE [Oligoflexia bacterium]
MESQDNQGSPDEKDEKSKDSSHAARDADFSAFEPRASDKQQVEQASDVGEVKSLKVELEATKDKYLRALAELENYKKRALKERSELIRYQGDRIIADLLEVVDNLELALSHSEADPVKLKTGLELIHKLFVDVLGRWDVRAVPAVGKPFDPQQHQALSKIQSADAAPGTVISEFKKAYFYKDKLLRPASVVVSEGSVATSTTNAADVSEKSAQDGPQDK